MTPASFPISSLRPSSDFISPPSLCPIDFFLPCVLLFCSSSSLHCSLPPLQLRIASLPPPLLDFTCILLPFVHHFLTSAPLPSFLASFFLQSSSSFPPFISCTPCFLPFIHLFFLRTLPLPSRHPPLPLPAFFTALSCNLLFLPCIPPLPSSFPHVLLFHPCLFLLLETAQPP